MLIMILIPQIANLLPGSVFFLGDSLISWKGKKQSIVSQLSTEPEYRAMTSTIKDIVWLRWLLADMRISFSHPTPMYCDNQSSIQIAHNSVFHERTKHIEIDCHLTRHHLKHGAIALPFVPSSLQIFLPRHIPSLIFVFWLANSRCL
jgi:hypothetical protein